MATLWIHEHHAECRLCGRRRSFPAFHPAERRVEWMDAHMSAYHPEIDRTAFDVWEVKRTQPTTIPWRDVPPVMDRAGLQDMTFPKPDARTIVVTDTIPIGE